MKKTAILLLACFTFLGIIATVVFATRAARFQREASIAQANADALLDTVQRYKADSTTTATLMARQQELNSDSLAKLNESLALALDGRGEALEALSIMRVEFNRLRTEFVSTEVAPVRDEPEAQQATFKVTGPPIEGDILVIYRPVQPWTIRPNLGVTPFRQIYSVGCDELKRALVNITTPDWVRATIEEGVITPDVCNRPIAPLLSFSWDKGLWFGGGVVAGALLWNLFDSVLDSGDNGYRIY